jgi:hypothetical protein
MNTLPLLALAAVTAPTRLRLFQPEPPVAEADAWAQHHFGAADLGDRRRTRRLVRVAAHAATHPSGSLPHQNQSWADTKAAYRLCDCPDVTFAAVCQPHWDDTRRCAPGRYLVLEDTTEIDFGWHRDVAGLGPLGNGSGQGFLLHSALLVAADSDAVYGMAGQTIHYRQPAPRGESATRRLQRDDRESRVWGVVIDQVGRPPEGVQWVHVLDRGGDNFDVFGHARAQGTDCVVRASSLHRKVLTPQGDEVTLRDYLTALPVAGSYTLDLRARQATPARQATLEVLYGSLTMPRPRVASRYGREQAAVPLGVVWVREARPPKGVKRIEWVLYTSLPVRSLAQAQEVIGYYEKRWLIEEWHKALKSGCRVEERQLETADRLEPLVGLLGVVAVRLLQLRALARSQPGLPALEVLPRLYVQMLQRLRKWGGGEWTVREFFREVAQLGGFLGRKGDGEPGWQTIWRGWDLLQSMVRGAELARELDG